MPNANPVAVASATRSTAPETALPITAARSGRPALSLAVPSMNTAGGYSLSRQLGLGISRVVIDPGHGGHDPGAKVKGLNEADIVLDISQRLEKLLKRQPGGGAVEAAGKHFRSAEARGRVHQT